MDGRKEVGNDETREGRKEERKEWMMKGRKEGMDDERKEGRKEGRGERLIKAVCKF